MQKMGRTLRWIARLAVGVVIVTVALLVVVQIEQRVVRHRAKRLLADIRSLQPGKSNWSDAQRLITQWGAWGHYDGRCDAHSCEYSIVMVDRFLPGVSWLANLSGAPFNPDPPIMRLVKLLHANLPVVSASISIHDGRVTRIWFWVSTHVPKGYGPGWTKDLPDWTEDTPEPSGYMEYKSGQYNLVASAHSSSQLLSTAYWPSKLVLHPDYWVGKPGGCEGCLGFDTQFTAATKKEDLDWLMDFNLSCMTRWMPCTVSSDLMPEAWRRYVAERKMNSGILSFQR
jgi:hypothetical protein